MVKIVEISGRAHDDLAKAVTAALDTAIRSGVECDEACCIAVAITADYARYCCGDQYLKVLALLVRAPADGRPVPKFVDEAVRSAHDFGGSPARRGGSQQAGQRVLVKVVVKSGTLEYELEKAISTALQTAMLKGVERDGACCITGAITAAFATFYCGERYLKALARLMRDQAHQPPPKFIDPTLEKGRRVKVERLTIAGAVYDDMGRAVTAAIHAGISSGIGCDVASCIATQVTADYARKYCGDGYLEDLAELVMLEPDQRKVPEFVHAAVRTAAASDKEFHRPDRPRQGTERALVKVDLPIGRLEKGFEADISNAIFTALRGGAECNKACWIAIAITATFASVHCGVGYLEALVRLLREAAISPLPDFVNRDH